MVGRTLREEPRVIRLLCTVVMLVAACAGSAEPEAFGIPRDLSAEEREALTESFNDMERARVLDGSDEAALSAYAETTEALEHFDLAAAALKKLVRFTPDDAERWHRLGAALSLQGAPQGEAAFAALARSRALNPNDARTHFLIGSLYHRQGIYDAAAESYESAKELAIARVGLAVLKVYANDISGAENDLKVLGAEAQPFDVQTRLWLRDALEAWEHSGHRLDDTAESHGAYARLLYRAARFPEAVLALRRATVLAPDQAEHWNLLGAILSQLGDFAQAQKAYESSLQANPDQPELRKALEQATP